MDAILFVDLLIKVLIAACALLSAVAVIFLAIRPLLDPHWTVGLAPSGGAQGRDDHGDMGTHGMQGT
jgi:hypothetical protein